MSRRSLQTHGSGGFLVLFAQFEQEFVLQDFAPHPGLGLSDGTVGGQVDVLLLAVRMERRLGVIDVGLDLRQDGTGRVEVGD